MTFIPLWSSTPQHHKNSPLLRNIYQLLELQHSSSLQLSTLRQPMLFL